MKIDKIMKIDEIKIQKTVQNYDVEFQTMFNNLTYPFEMLYHQIDINIIVENQFSIFKYYNEKNSSLINQKFECVLIQYFKNLPLNQQYEILSSLQFQLLQNI